VNPNLDDIDGEAVYDSLRDIPEKIDIVDVFRKSDFVPSVVEDAIAFGAKTVWCQLDVVSDEGRERALAAGLNYAENICIRTEHQRLFTNLVQG
jgi:predicted CoA-binding protein